MERDNTIIIITNEVRIQVIEAEEEVISISTKTIIRLSQNYKRSKINLKWKLRKREMLHLPMSMKKHSHLELKRKKL